MIGHELVDKGEYFYLINRPAEKATTQDAKAKLHASLICIVRLITHEKGKLFEYLSNVNYGVTTEDLNIDDFLKVFNHTIDIMVIAKMSIHIGNYVCQSGIFI